MANDTTLQVKILSVSKDKSGQNGVFFEIDKELTQLEEGAEVKTKSFSKSRETLLKELSGVELVDDLEVLTEGAPTLFSGFVGCVIPILKGREITIIRHLAKKGEIVNGFEITEDVYITTLKPTEKEIKVINEKANTRLFDKATQRLNEKSFDF